MRKVLVILAALALPVLGLAAPAAALGTMPNTCGLAPQPVVSVGGSVGMNAFLNTTAKTVYVVWTFGNGSTVTQAVPAATNHDNLVGLQTSTTVLSAGTITASVYRSLANKPMVTCTDTAV